MIKSDILYTPKLKVRYIGLASPYFANVADLKGSYSVSLVGTDEETGEWITEMDQIHEDLLNQLQAESGKKKLKLNDPVAPIHADEDREGELTGLTLVKLRHAAKGVSKQTGREWEITPKVFDAHGKPIPQETVAKLGWGSVVRCSFTARAYTFGANSGIAYDLRATQIITPTWFEAGGGNDFADKIDEEGFALTAEADSDF